MSRIIHEILSKKLKINLSEASRFRVSARKLLGIDHCRRYSLSEKYAILKIAREIVECSENDR